MVESHNHILVVKLFTKRRVNLEVLTNTLRSMWRSIRFFEVRDLGSNTVLIIFEDETDPQKLMVQGPWTFDKYLLAIGKTLGIVEHVDASTIGECCGRYLRVRIQLDITQPLCRERMCGLLNHDEKDYTLSSDSGKTLCTEEQQYGTWLCTPINTLRQPKMATDKPTPQSKHPSGPP
ncbi:hypothetical protein CFP56_005411 [Quercus suber]|uniref:DUF4283 domain-containing protein n=1 Tax=Quercus suber TaxID=58331 RepID=A0AAW0L9G5_QUESU